MVITFEGYEDQEEMVRACQRELGAAGVDSWFEETKMSGPMLFIRDAEIKESARFDFDRTEQFNEDQQAAMLHTCQGIMQHFGYFTHICRRGGSLVMKAISQE